MHPSFCLLLTWWEMEMCHSEVILWHKINAEHNETNNTKNKTTEPHEMSMVMVTIPLKNN